jgi:hypothetical protein
MVRCAPPLRHAHSEVQGVHRAAEHERGRLWGRQRDVRREDRDLERDPRWDVLDPIVDVSPRGCRSGTRPTCLWTSDFLRTKRLAVPVPPAPTLWRFLALLTGVPYGGGRRERAAAQSNGVLALRLGLASGDAAACTIEGRFAGVTGSNCGCLCSSGDSGDAGTAPRRTPLNGLSGDGVCGVVPVDANDLRGAGDAGSAAALFFCANRRRDMRRRSD